jgi:outer membrane lipoprotein-sorting protein
MKRFFLLSTLSLAPFVFAPLVSAQELSADEIVANITESVEAIQDAQFLMTGNLIDTDTQEIPLEVTLATIPAENILRADFLQPDALTDNSIVVDGEEIYNYVYLTNQVSVFNMGDPRALGGLSFTNEFQFTLDISVLFAGWTASSQGLSEGNYTLRFNNDAAKEGANIGYVDTQVSTENWLPTSMNFYDPEGALLGELFFSDYVLNSGLNPDDVRYIDPSAELIDER